jgi:hypothetical protein
MLPIRGGPHIDYPSHENSRHTDDLGTAGVASAAYEAKREVWSRRLFLVTVIELIGKQSQKDQMCGG